VETSVGAGVEKRVESKRAKMAAGEKGLRVRLLGPLAISRDGIALKLPSSRKARALLAYLALAPRAVSRSQLCELLWDGPDDPRGELRWCLSKLRLLVDTPGRQRIETEGDSIRLDLADAFVDTTEIARAVQQGIATLPIERQRSLAALFAGDVADGLELDRSPGFTGWLTAHRRRFRGCHTALLEQLVVGVGGGGDDDEAFACLEAWLLLAPFDRRVHEMMLQALARRGRIREGEEHLAATARLFEAEGLDVGPLRAAWRAARAQAASPLSAGPPAAPDARPAETTAPASRRASIAVMPFVEPSAGAGARGETGDALAYDVITRLAKLRSLFVIAPGTVFALQARCIGAEEAGRMLNVDYVVGGTLRRQGNRLTVTVDLVEARTARILWAEIFNHTLDDAFLVLDEIGNRIVASVAGEIEAIERNRAILRPPNSLDAWEAHHRGLWHMYRFSKDDNARARHFFEMALRLDPTFARAHAGLSFTHFQNAFQGWAKRAPEVDRAFAAAGHSLAADDRDPAAHWAMGRALWLRGQHDQSVVELQQAVDLSPNFAQGHYTLAFVQSQSGDPHAAIAASDHSRHLSPFDPLLFGMLGARAMALVRLGRFDEAADWATQAAARPNAHAHIRAIAAFALALAGRRDQAQAQLGEIRRALPRYRVDDFFAAMQIDAEGTKLFRQGAKALGVG
jgi:DNA-binding SARP family transcriptional activator